MKIPLFYYTFCIVGYNGYNLIWNSNNLCVCDLITINR